VKVTGAARGRACGQAAGATHEHDDLWTFSFEPVETGEHTLHVRLEYATAADARHEPADAFAGKFLGLPLPGSPFSVSVQSDWVAAGPLASLDELPLCGNGADRPGLWRNVGTLGPHQLEDGALFACVPLAQCSR